MLRYISICIVLKLCTYDKIKFARQLLMKCRGKILRCPGWTHLTALSQEGVGLHRKSEKNVDSKIFFEKNPTPH